MKGIAFSCLFLLLCFDSISQSSESNNHEFKKYYSKFRIKAILFDSLNYREDCLYRSNTIIFTGFAVRKYSDQKEVFCHVKNGKIDTAILYDSVLKIIKEVSLFYPEFKRRYFWFYESGQTEMMVFHLVDDRCDSIFKYQIQDVFGPTPNYLHIKNYYPSGKLKFEKKYDTFAPFRSESKFFYEKGKLFAVTFTENQRGVGKWKMYNKTGIRIGFVKWENEKIKNARGMILIQRIIFIKKSGLKIT